MYMRVMRALEYVKSLPEWDGKNLIVAGASQGGAQVIAACALDKDVTLARAGVPAMCDHSGVTAAIPRSSGWPALYNRSKDGKADDPATAECAAYYDGCYFAKRIKCPIYISTGLLDNTCPPTSVFAAYNSIPAGTFKHITIDPRKGHSGVVDREFPKALKAVCGK
jgi:cephalosporin-C deacetylase-like acetyl esterase